MLVRTLDQACLAKPAHWIAQFKAHAAERRLATIELDDIPY